MASTLEDNCLLDSSQPSLSCIIHSSHFWIIFLRLYTRRVPGRRTYRATPLPKESPEVFQVLEEFPWPTLYPKYVYTDSGLSRNSTGSSDIIPERWKHYTIIIPFALTGPVVLPLKVRFPTKLFLNHSHPQIFSDTSTLPRTRSNSLQNLPGFISTSTLILKLVGIVRRDPRLRGLKRATSPQS